MKKALFLSVFALTSVLTLTSCTDPTGGSVTPIPGPAGQDGQDGVDGKDGATWLTGEGEPEADLGNTGDLYLDTATSDIYTKKETGWEIIGNIKGDKGDKGDTGAQGEQGIQGNPGKDGATWLTGEGEPAADLGNTGDLYLDTATSNIYTKDETGWKVIGNIKGDTGAQGEQGETAWSNTILPAQGAYITADKGSAIADGKETVTFTAVDTDPDDGKIPFSINLVNNGVTETYDLDDNGQYTAVMKEGGYVVSLNFSEEIKSVDTLKDLFDSGSGALTSGVNAFQLTEGTFDFTPEANKQTLNFANSERVVISGSVDEEGNPTTTLDLGRNISFNGASEKGSLELKNVNIELSGNVSNYNLMMFNFGENITLENVHFSINHLIVQSNSIRTPLYFNTTNSNVTLKDVTLENNGSGSDYDTITYYDAIQIWAAKNFTAENVNVSGFDNPFSIHIFDAGNTFSFTNCHFDTYSPIILANEHAFARKTEEEYNQFIQELEKDRPQINLTNCSFVNQYNYLGYYKLKNVSKAADGSFTNAYQINTSWLDINVSSTTYKGNSEYFDNEILLDNEIITDKTGIGRKLFTMYKSPEQGEEKGTYFDNYPTPHMAFNN